MAAISAEELRELVARALAEDLGDGDVTAEATVPAEARARARIVQKAPGVVFGLDRGRSRRCARPGWRTSTTSSSRAQWREEVPAEVLVAARLGPRAARRRAHRAQLPRPPLRGRDADRALRRGGRRHRAPTILDTRKTTPGLRGLEKAAVAAGGGTNHRMGLYDAILIKENHIAARRQPRQGRPRAPARPTPSCRSRSRCRNLDEAAYALGTGADRLLLDNMDPPTLRDAVELRDATAGGARADRSRPRAASTSRPSAPIAETGVDFISVGALTHSAPVLDFSLLLSAD